MRAFVLAIIKIYWLYLKGTSMAINQAAINSGAAHLHDLFARVAQSPGLPADCAGLTEADGYAIQSALLARLSGDQPIARVGYKIGCTNAAARGLLNADHPFHGTLLADRCYASPAQLGSNQFNTLGIEPELALVLGADLPSQVDPYTAETVADAVVAVLPAIEVVDSRYLGWTAVGLPSLVADNGVNAGWVEGPSMPAAKIDLMRQPVALRRNGKIEHEGVGANVDGGPLTVLAWLANMLNRQGEMLKAGQKISTGTLTPVLMAAPGDHIEADFGSLGAVSINFN